MVKPVDDAAETLRSDSRIPRHIAVIMDGNNRWAKQRGQAGIAGHRQGAEAARRMVELCMASGVEVLTLFVFSSENWSRPKKEVNALMALFLRVLRRKEVMKLHENNIRLIFIGNRRRFSPKLQKLMAESEHLTAKNTAFTVAVAADYGGRWDIANAARQIALEVAAGRLDPEQVDDIQLQKHLALADYAMPDLCIRTGGEKRISNFLLWQMAYTELYFCDIYWPDFGEAEFKAALADYAGRQRRYGLASEQLESEN